VSVPHWVGFEGKWNLVFDVTNVKLATAKPFEGSKNSQGKEKRMRKINVC